MKAACLASDAKRVLPQWAHVAEHVVYHSRKAGAANASERLVQPGTPKGRVTGELNYEHGVRTPPKILEACRRIQADFEEMPDLALTLEQGARFWGLNPQITKDAFELLVQRGFVRRARGAYRRA